MQNFRASVFLRGTAAAVINAAGLARTFQTERGPVEAVRGIDLTVREGEILGFLGPNGAGKTTTLRMLTTLLAPTGGTASVAGHDQAAARARELAHDLGFAGLLDRKCGALSGGQRRRLDIAMALAHRPKVLFLDEPTTGLDPGSRADLWDLVRRLHDEHGTTVFLTTHYPDEADARAERLVVLDLGVVAAEGTPSAHEHAHAVRRPRRRRLRDTRRDSGHTRLPYHRSVTTLATWSI
ncbi:ABC transporter ATP-binding protein [Streptomyces sp. NPDC059629]|uniref:ABC transporter ATP-binding protein n=1 Tax=Streptomyces sp. NPDC059629 TaxID=3346889 RepID=UPI0036C7163C